MERISTSGATQLYISRMMTVQARMQAEQVQVTTGFRSEAYSGIASNARRAINMENERSLAENFLSSNTALEVRQSTASDALNSMQTSISTLKSRLVQFASGQLKDQASIRDVQDLAMRTMVELGSALGTSVDGDYLFSGGRNDTNPVGLPASDLASFQAMFNGSTSTYPTSRAGNLLDLLLTKSQTGNVNFNATSGVIVPANAGAYADVPTGGNVQISGTALNNGNFTIRGHAATSISGRPLTETSNAGNGAFISYVGGTINHATSGNLGFSFDKDGNTVIRPANANTLSALTPGAKFTVAGSDATTVPITAADTTLLMGTNLSTYAANATSGTGVTIAQGDSLTLSDGTLANTFSFSVTGATTVKDVVNWVNGLNAGGFMSASVDNQGRLNLANLEGAAGQNINITGPLQSLLGLPAAATPSAGIAGTPGPAVQSSALYDSVDAQTLTSLTSAAGTPLVAVGDQLTFKVGAAPLATFPVAANTTMTDLVRWVQQQDPAAAVTLSGGKLNITNNNGAIGYTIGGTLATDLGLPAAIANGATGSSAALVLPGNFDGAYKVVAYDGVTGSVTLANDTDTAKPETVAISSLGLQMDTPVLDGIPDTVAGTGLASGTAAFTVSGNTVTMTLPSGGTDLTTLFASGDPITLSGTAGHNGTFQVASVTANTVSFRINPDALRVSPFVPQTNRSDVTMTFPTTQPDTVAGVPTSLPGTVYGGVATLDKNVFGSLSFNPNGTITASTPGMLTNNAGLAYPPVGAAITLKSSSGVNDGVYEVASNDGTNITIKAATLKSELGSPVAQMSATSWYKGDTLAMQAHIDSNATIDTSIPASNSAFEKAMRACGLIAQGVFGTAGGLDQHSDRVQAAITLLSDSLQHSATDKMPYGPEQSGDIDGLQKRVGLNLSAIDTKKTSLTQFKAFLDTRVSDIEQIDSATAIMSLQNDSTALQSSYRALAQSQQLSLINFLK
jgi:flagellin-like hook-associated protein FlgL